MLGYDLVQKQLCLISHSVQHVITIAITARPNSRNHTAFVCNLNLCHRCVRTFEGEREPGSNALAAQCGDFSLSPVSVLDVLAR